MYNLPKYIIFCDRCVQSNQMPSSIPEYLHTPERKGATYLNIQKNKKGENICDPCVVEEEKKKIDWYKREKELVKLCDKFRKSDGSYDCVVPGSGGKDSVYASHILKEKYGMNPLTVTWPPIMYTDYGYHNFKNWLDIGGFDNISFKPNGKVQKILTKLSIEKLLHPFQTFILGQKNIGPRIAARYNIPLVFYGESEAEYNNPISELKALRDKKYWLSKNKDNYFLAGIPIKELMNDYKINYNDLKPYLPLDESEIGNIDMQVHYLGYYLKWVPQEAYYYATEHTNFKARPFRTEGTYSKYNSIDDKIDDLHYYTTYIKFGLGRATYDSSQEVRNDHLTRNEAVKLVERFDGEFPEKYIDEIFKFLEIDKGEFLSSLDKFRPSHLWEKKGNNWKLKKTVFD